MQRTRPADLIERTQAAQPAAQHLRRAPKDRARQNAVGIGEVRMVEQVEGVQTELQIQRLDQLEIAAQGYVNLTSALSG